MANIRLEQTVRASIASLCTFFCLLAAFAADSVRFEHKTLPVALHDISGWFYFIWAFTLSSLPVAIWHSPAGDPEEKPEKPPRFSKSVRDWIGMALIIGWLVSGDVKVSEILLRSIWIFPWVASFGLVTDLILVRWRIRKAPELRKSQVMMQFRKERKAAERVL